MSEIIRNFKRDIFLYKKIFKEKGIYDGVNLFTKFKINLNGFTADQYICYNLKENNLNEYVSEYERQQTKKLNGPYNFIMDNKLVFEKFFSHYVNVPKTFCWVESRQVYPLSQDNKNIQDLLFQEVKLILKPVQGTGGGKGVHVLEFTDSGYLWDDQELSWIDVINKINKLNDYVVVEYVKQHEYANKIFSKTVNTIRLVTIKDIDNGKPLIPIAVQRIGVEKSFPVDIMLKKEALYL